MNKLLILTAAVAAFSANATFAADGVQASTPACATCSKPVPVYVVNPINLPREAQDTTVELVLTIDEKGIPHDVKPLYYVDTRVSARLKEAVAQWRFAPRVEDGRAVTTRAVLPVKLAGA